MSSFFKRSSNFGQMKKLTTRLTRGLKFNDSSESFSSFLYKTAQATADKDGKNISEHLIPFLVRIEQI